MLIAGYGFLIRLSVSPGSLFYCLCQVSVLRFMSICTRIFQHWVRLNGDTYMRHWSILWITYSRSLLSLLWRNNKSIAPSSSLLEWVLPVFL